MPARGVITRHPLISGVVAIVVGVVVAFLGLWVLSDRGSDWTVPDVEGDTTGVIAGAVYNGRGAVEGAEIVVGNSGAPFNGDVVRDVTDSHGGFVVRIPDDAVGSIPGWDDVFVQVTMAGEGPADDETTRVAMRYPAEFGNTNLLIEAPTPTPCAFDSSECDLLLPDLSPLLDGVELSPLNPPPPESVQLDTVTQPGRTLLRFASMSANIGAGPLHVVAAGADGNGRNPTVQRVWSDELGFADRPAGEFIFHDGHDHIHIDSFERYRLLDVDGAEVAVSEKISFCLRDSGAVDRALEQPFLLVRGLECGAVEQAINVGFADYYGADLPDQWIDVTGVPDGEYEIEIEVDPEGVLLESDETNNVARFAVTLGPSTPRFGQ